MATKKAKAPAKAAPADDDAPTPVEAPQSESAPMPPVLTIPADTAPTLSVPHGRVVSPLDQLADRVADLEDRVRNMDGKKPKHA